MIIYLYLKTHNKTGLQYLGKTIQDPFKYKGSGLVWQRHIKKHGNDVTTQILLATDDKDDLRETGVFFSKLFNVVNNKNFANLTEESGDGGATRGIGWNHSESTKQKLRTPKKNTLNMKQAQQNRAAEISREKIKLHQDPSFYKNKIELIKTTLHGPESCAKRSRTMSKLKWCNDGVRNYRLEYIPSNYSLGKIKIV